MPDLILTSIVTSAIAAIIGALVGAIVSKVKTASKAAEESKEMQRLTLMMTCRMAIYDEHFSIDEKIDAYVIYRDVCHGNHQTKKHMDKLVGCDIDEYIERHRS